MNIFRITAIIIVTFAIAFCVGWYVRLNIDTGLIYDAGQRNEVRENSADYKFINPLILVDTNSKDPIPEYKKLESVINNYITTSEQTGNAKSVSVYYRDLNSGRWTGVNEDETYEPASLYKVALMVAYLKESQTEPDILKKEVLYTGTSSDFQYFKPQQTLVQGKYYTIDTLIQSMITQSDNVATNILYANVDPSFVNKVNSDLGLPEPSMYDFMSAKSYSYLFRSIYNATYLYRKASENALNILSQTDFPYGLTASVPTSTVVSHKFGERTNQTSDGVVQGRELHDCGIIYYPGSPYFLCVMTKGTDFESLKKVISDISKIVYTQEATLSKVQDNQ